MSLSKPIPILREVALAIALGYAAARIHEEGGNNRGDQVEFFQHLMGGSAGDSWCADFISTCLVKSYARCHDMPEVRSNLLHMVNQVTRLLPLSGSCATLARIATERYQFRSREYDPVAGDIVLFDFPDEHGKQLGHPHHVGFVKAAHPNGTLSTVEGNTSSGVQGSQGDGDGVFERTRQRNHTIYGYIHLN